MTAWRAKPARTGWRRRCLADDHNFYKVEKWTRDGTKVDSLLYAGNSLGRARAVFERSIKHRSRIRLTIRQRTRLLDQWPPAHAR